MRILNWLKRLIRVVIFVPFWLVAAVGSIAYVALYIGSWAFNDTDTSDECKSVLNTIWVKGISCILKGE